MSTQNLQALNKNNSESVNIEITILPSGDVLIGREADRKTNMAALDVLKEMGVDTTYLAEFFYSQDNVEQLYGKETLCG
jgi:hypothetical protein